jgi:hypothetical protein
MLVYKIYKKGNRVMRRAQTVLGIVVKSSAVGAGCVFWGLAGLAWAEAPDAQVQDQPPKGFFVNLSLAQGYKESLDSFQTERFKPVNPGTTFKSDVEAVYMVFDLLPRENPANVIGQLFQAEGEGWSNEKFLHEEAAYLTTAQESGFLVFPRPKGGWAPGEYKVRIHLGEEITDASQIGTLRFKIAP